MKKGLKWGLIVIVAILLIGTVIYFNYPKASENPSCTEDVCSVIPSTNSSTVSEIANPASVYCGENNGSPAIRTDSDGGQYGVCMFSDGSECEEWAFFRGEC